MKPNEGTRRASQLIEELDAGALDAEASKELRGLLQSITDKIARDGTASGSLTIKLTFTAGFDKKLCMVGEVTSKRPSRKRVSANAWIHGDAIAESDPDQMTFHEQLVNAPAGKQKPLNSTK